MDEIRIQNIRCLIKKPEGFTPEKKYPVLLFLHGAGTRGSDINKLRENLFFKMTEPHALPFVIFAPLCEKDTWFDVWEHLELLADEVINSPFADRERVYLMGASMGGYATWQLAMSMPESFAAIVPICGGGMYWNAGRLVNIPVWAFHGAKDPIVYMEESRKMVEAVNARGGRARLTVYPENGHDAWSDTYSNPEVFEWLLRHRNENARENGSEYSDPKIYG